MLQQSADNPAQRERRRAVEKAKKNAPKNTAEREQQKATGKNSSGDVFIEKTTYMPDISEAASSYSRTQDEFAFQLRTDAPHWIDPSSAGILLRDILITRKTRKVR